MRDYKVIDAHVHTYPTQEIGRQALSGFDASGCGGGTTEELTDIMETAQIGLAVQCNMTPARSMLEGRSGGYAPRNPRIGPPRPGRKNFLPD